MVKGLGIGEGQWECRGPLRTLENTSIQEEKKVAAQQRQAQEKTVVGNNVLIESQLGKVLIQRGWNSPTQQRKGTSVKITIPMGNLWAMKSLMVGTGLKGDKEKYFEE